MNFDFMMECEIKDPKIKTAYDEIYKELVEAEKHYWKEPQQSGILFRKTAERICRFIMIIMRSDFRKVHC